MNYLLFLLSGTLSAWGLPLQGNTRKTDDHPTKSGVSGLIAASLGVSREMVKELTQIAQLGFACREDNPGTILKDFHIVRVGPGIVSNRFYLVNAIFTVCIWENENCPYTLKKIMEALNRPIYTPFLGRKCCSYDIPPDPKIVKAESLSEAFEQYSLPEFLNGSLKGREKNRIFWEGTDTSIKIVKSNQRFDQVTGPKQYRSRIEYMGWKEVSNVSE